MSKNSQSLLGLFDIIGLIILIVSLISILLLVIGRFNVYLTVFLSVIVLLLCSAKFYKFVSIHLLSRDNLILFSILLLAVFFRYPPYLHTIVDWDPGIYVIMSETYANTGSVVFKDPVQAKIKDPVLLKIYETYNNMVVLREGPKGLYQGARIGGIRILDADEGKYASQYYPLHPLWMSVFSRLFGSENRVYSLVFFSLISISAVFLIVQKLTGSNTPAIIAGILLALNPLHAFFSKEPSSEVVFMAFIFSGLYFLLKYYTASKSLKQNKIHLILSAGLIGCSFFTHIHGFMYLPFFYFLAIISILYVKDKTLKLHMLIYVTSILSLYGLSVLYGYNYNFSYLNEVMGPVFYAFLGNSWKFRLVSSLVVLFVIPFLLYYVKSKNLNFFNRLENAVNNKRGLLLFVAFLFLSLFVFYKYFFVIFSSGSLYYVDFLIKIVSLPIFILPFFAMYMYSKREIGLFSVCFLFVLFFFFYLQYGNLPIYPNSRYLLPELVPLCIILSSFMLADMLKNRKTIKILACVVLLFVASSYIYYLSFQFQGKNSEGVSESLIEVSKHIKDRDLLLFEKNNYYPYLFIKPTLEYYYMKPVFGIDDALNLTLPEFSNFFQNYNDVFLLAMREINQTPDLKFDQISNISFRRGNYKETVIPVIYGLDEKKLWLYKLNRNESFG